MKRVPLALLALLLTGCAAPAPSANPGGGSVNVPAASAPAGAPASKAPAAAGGLADGSFTSTPPTIKDTFGMFGGTARVTNAEGDKEKTATFTYTLFKGAEQVGTAVGVANTIGAGKVATVTLTSTDAYVAGPYRVEFQVDAEF